MVNYFKFILIILNFNFFNVILSYIEPLLNFNEQFGCYRKLNSIKTPYLIYNHTQFNYLIEEPSLCQGKIGLLLYIQTALDHLDRRKIIRETFGSLNYASGKKYQLLFVVGVRNDTKLMKMIMDESDKFHDIVQANFLDVYKNLTLKHIVALDWINKHCNEAEFISKTDDDVFINVFSLSTFLYKNFKSKYPFVLGNIYSNEGPIRAPGYKWTVSKEEYPYSKYPPFMKGYGYIMSRGAIKPLWLCSYSQKFFYIDDVFITGLVVNATNGLVRRLSLANFAYRTIGIQSYSNKIGNYIYLLSNNELKHDLWIKAWKSSLSDAILTENY